MCGHHTSYLNPVSERIGNGEESCYGEEEFREQEGGKHGQEGRLEEENDQEVGLEMLEQPLLSIPHVPPVRSRRDFLARAGGGFPIAGTAFIDE